MWIWPRVPFADEARCGSLPPLPRKRSSRASYVISIWPPSHLPLHLPVCAKQRSTGSAKPTTSHVVSGATCVQWRCVSCLKSFEIPSPPAFPGRPFRGRRPRAPLRHYPTPSCGACPAPAKATQHRAPPGAGLAPRRSGGAPARRWARGSIHGAGWPAARALGGSRRGAPEDAKSALEFLSARLYVSQ